MGPFGFNGEEVGRDEHWVPSTDHREASVVVRIRYVEDARGGRRVGVSRNAVSDDLHRETACNRVTVSGATPTI